LSLKKSRCFASFSLAQEVPYASHRKVLPKMFRFYLIFTHNIDQMIFELFSAVCVFYADF